MVVAAAVGGWMEVVEGVAAVESRIFYQLQDCRTKVTSQEWIRGTSGRHEKNMND